MMARGFVYLTVVLDWFSRRVLSSCRRRAFSAARVSISMEAAFCIEALEEALAKHRSGKIVRTTGTTSVEPANYLE